MDEQKQNKKHQYFISRYLEGQKIIIARDPSDYNLREKEVAPERRRRIIYSLVAILIAGFFAYLNSGRLGVAIVLVFILGWLGGLFWLGIFPWPKVVDGDAAYFYDEDDDAV